jgi:hypothetical protein
LVQRAIYAATTMTTTTKSTPKPSLQTVARK